MPVPGEPYDEPLRPLYEHATATLPDGAAWLDAHTHTGHNDPDGRWATAGEIMAGLDRAGQERAIVFTLHEPDGYPAANDRVLSEAASSGGRLIPLARIDPRARALAEAHRCLEAGARGFKLHPRAERFTLSEPAVAELIALAHEHRLPVLVHAGRGIPSLGSDALRLARRYPDARLILAHAGISDLALLARHVAGCPNLYFDTSWWNVADLLALFASVPPARILYASDMPYGTARFAGLAALRCGLAVGLEGEVLAGIVGGQAARLVEGAEPLDLGPAPGPGALPRDLSAERVVAHLTGAVACLFSGGRPEESLALARLACTSSDGAAPSAVLATAADLIDRALAACADRPCADRPGTGAAPQERPGAAAATEPGTGATDGGQSAGNGQGEGAPAPVRPGIPAWARFAALPALTAGLVAGTPGVGVPADGLRQS